MRLCAASVIGAYVDKRGDHIVNRLRFFRASNAQEAEQQAFEDFAADFPHCKVVHVAIEPAPGGNAPLQHPPANPVSIIVDWPQK